MAVLLGDFLLVSLQKTKRSIIIFFIGEFEMSNEFGNIEVDDVGERFERAFRIFEKSAHMMDFPNSGKIKKSVEEALIAGVAEAETGEIDELRGQIVELMAERDSLRTNNNFFKLWAIDVAKGMSEAKANCVSMIGGIESGETVPDKKLVNMLIDIKNLMSVDLRSQG